VGSHIWRSFIAPNVGTRIVASARIQSSHSGQVSAAASSHPFARHIIKETREGTMAEYTLRIDGMHCGSCVRRVTETLAAIDGVTVNEVRLGAARITSELTPSPVDLVIAALDKAGFTARLES
jgi:copper chaperone